MFLTVSFDVGYTTSGIDQQYNFISVEIRSAGSLQCITGQSDCQQPSYTHVERQQIGYSTFCFQGPNASATQTVVVEVHKAISQTTETSCQRSMAEELVLVPKVKYQTMIRQLEERSKESTETTQTGGEPVKADKKIEDGQPQSNPVQSSEMTQPPHSNQSSEVTQMPNSVQSSEVTQLPRCM
jgi:hypothetical protein